MSEGLSSNKAWPATRIVPEEVAVESALFAGRLDRPCTAPVRCLAFASDFPNIVKGVACIHPCVRPTGPRVSVNTQRINDGNGPGVRLRINLHKKTAICKTSWENPCYHDYLVSSWCLRECLSTHKPLFGYVSIHLCLSIC